MTYRFKVGDRVRRIRSSNGQYFLLGQIGTVTEVDYEEEDQEYHYVYVTPDVWSNPMYKNDGGVANDPRNLELAVIFYDPKQAGDREDDI